MASRTCFGVSLRPLVVDTVGFNDQVNIDAGGHPHSGELRIEERFHRIDFGPMQLRITIDDPKDVHEADYA
jgi:hypothetical protein